MYSYETATSRNIGWLTKMEQQLIRYKRVAVAGLGGVGGAHLVTLSRLGVSRFHVSDFDDFEVHNFNRQAGATLDAVGRPKMEVMIERVRQINPEAEFEGFANGVGPDNVDAFLDGVDLYVDSLDFFALEARRLVFQRCHEKGIPAITAAPLGMGCAFLAFTPDSMSFERYFDLEGYEEEQQLVRFLVGLAPTVWQRHYLVEPGAADFRGRKGPSVPMAVDLCAGVAGTNALKLLLGRGKVVKAPNGLHFDAYLNRCRVTRRPGGNRHPLQRLAILLASRKLGLRM